MRLHSFQHVPFEDMAHIEVWANERGYTVSKTLFFNDEKLPEIDDLDWLVVMGGPMGIYEEERYPWLVKEKKFIEQAIASKKHVLGICLGAQLIADVLGARVYKNEYKEIGWHPVSSTREASSSIAFQRVPERFTAFHWHGDTFDIPAGSNNLAQSEGCANQAFEFEGKVVGLQFHLESTGESIDKLIDNCRDEIVRGSYIQSQEKIQEQYSIVRETNKIMNVILDNLVTG